MTNMMGLIYTGERDAELRELTATRAVAAVPFCGRYRLIDFPLSAMVGSGIRNVGVIMQRDYQSLLDHIGSGKTWDMSRKDGGLRMLPPFGLPEYHRGNYTGTIEALNAVATYIRDIKEPNVILLLGSVCANIDLAAAARQHTEKNAEITAICADHELAGIHHRYVIGKDGFAEKLLFDRAGGDGLPSLEGYIIRRDTLLDMMDRCKGENKFRFHRDGLQAYLEDGGRINTYVHKGYASIIRTVDDYYTSSMDMLERDNISQMFPADRPVRTKLSEGVSTYYGENAHAKNSLVADNCIIEGDIENCIISSGARIADGARLRNCIVMRGCTVQPGCDLSYVIADKYVSFSDGTKLMGSPNLPVVVPKKSRI